MVVAIPLQLTVRRAAAAAIDNKVYIQVHLQFKYHLNNIWNCEIKRKNSLVITESLKMLLAQKEKRKK